jgi:iron(III) transport system ATP-binding protein
MIAGFEDLDEGELSVDDKLFSSSFKKYYLPPEQRDFAWSSRPSPSGLT